MAATPTYFRKMTSLQLLANRSDRDASGVDGRAGELHPWSAIESWSWPPNRGNLPIFRLWRSNAWKRSPSGTWATGFRSASRWVYSTSSTIARPSTSTRGGSPRPPERKGSERDSSTDRARLSLESHLGRLARLRPLASIADGAERDKAESLRDFFAKEFLDALVD